MTGIIRATLIATCALSACAAPRQSYVVPLSPEGAAQAAYDIAGFVSGQTRPDQGDIAIRKAPGDDLLWSDLTNTLHAGGYTITDGEARHSLRYAVSTLPDGTFLHATLDGTSIARLYRADPSGRLDPSGPETLITDEASE
jgi:hypothetical protein